MSHMWPILMLIAAFGMAISRLLQRSLLKDGKHDPVTYSIYIQILVGLIILPFALFNNFAIPSLNQIWFPFILMIILYGSANILFYKAVELTPISEVMIIAATMPVWVTLSSIPILGESITSIKALGILLAIVGVAIAFYSRNKFKLKKGHLLAFAAVIFFGLALTNDGFLLGYFNPITYSSLFFLLPGLLLAFIYPKKLPGLKSYISNSKSLLKFILGAILFAIASLLINTSFKIGAQITQISVMMQLIPIFTISLGIILFKERENLIQKVVGGMVVLTGVILIQLNI